MAVVEDLIVGRDGVVRGAKVRLVRKGKSVFLNRPVQKLFPTEVRHDEGKKKESQKEEESKENEKGVGNRQDGRPKKKKRAAALDSVWKTKGMID